MILKENELHMEKMTGVRIKIEETGTQLVNVLCKGNPWSGQDCRRVDCMMCRTRKELGIGKRQNCSNRSLLYETWCQTCNLRNQDRALEGETQTRSEFSSML